MLKRVETRIRQSSVVSTIHSPMPVLVATASYPSNSYGVRMHFRQGETEELRRAVQNTIANPLRLFLPVAFARHSRKARAHRASGFTVYSVHGY